MTAVASPPSFANINRPAWGLNGSSSLHAMNSDESRGVFTPRKALQRTNSASSVSSTASTSSTGTVINGHTNGAPSAAAGDVNGWNRKRVQPKGQWSQQPQPVKPEGVDFSRMPANRPAPSAVNGNASMHQAPIMGGLQTQVGQQGMIGRPVGDPIGVNQPVLYLLSLNGTFERKTISVPFSPDTLRIGRQTNARTVPTPVNGYFDSKVLSRQHAEIWAERSGKIYIRDIKSSNGTFVNGTRLSPENRDSEPHELQTSDHLELGIDIVNEDQKSVVHHKVAAKVEHAGFLNPTHALMDMSFGDIDPSGGHMMMQQMAGMPQRGRTGSQPSLNNGRMAPNAVMPGVQQNGMMQRNGYWMGPYPMETICNRLDQERRLAKSQLNELQRTADFLQALAGKDDIKLSDHTDAPCSKQAVNNSAVFRSDAGKATRFSEPPAPPPQQPLPEKPDAARSNGDPPSLKRGTTERPKLPQTSTSPVRQENFSQIIQLTETLNTAKKEIEGQSARIRDLEEMVQKEREQRQSAEGLVRKLEDAAVEIHANGPTKADIQDTLLAETFEPPADMSNKATDPVATKTDSDLQTEPETTANLETIETATAAADAAAAAEAAAKLQDRMDEILKEMINLREELESQRKRADKAEAERDGDRQTLAEMISQLRERDEQIAKLEAERNSRSRSSARSRGRSGAPSSLSEGDIKPVIGSYPETPTSSVTPSATPNSGQSTNASSQTGVSDDESTAGNDPTADKPTLSRASTITPLSKSLVHGSSSGSSDPAMAQAAPYASMIGVVLIGMGLMAWINGWQPQPRLDR
ncbi:hypothetical protein MGG_02878 [Pyricularia oryzae 70-15]|uniref:FHA domain-containing protein n=3 Tax=Pyricularia oryzae TaxID=318829 RepID=G5EHT6_PYRO7|nr:uncharacterized protein MGG_02878 [Pyricularia oryzae 70-15]ELQ43464.1 hypothetical protein OOU_Y34scaffold00150g11 [Pyricularia oryzae Y34]KAI7920129.1 hypothetical protein M0657_006721 [Pyricularia oryzae]EAQ71230.1 hypothetical protein MGCH7_ch7g637 [Pyricularia oryzae 70-15]EHA46110.1 hypothetical protein MGG_02878 [Pyricularia oryzae 70-15]KAI7922970.1 hypothetical protein M9X92_004631 [Pyricularia oryzae]